MRSISGGEFNEGDVFKTIIPLTSKQGDGVSDQAGDQVSDQDNRTKEILEFCKIPKSRGELQAFLEIKSRQYLRKKILTPLIKGGLLKLTIPDKPTSPKQKYYTAN